MSEPQVLHSKTSAEHEIVVIEDGDVRYLFFNDPGGREIISRMQMTSPSKLLAPYTQAMVLALAWNRQPSRMYLIGLGAGRLPWFFESVAPDCSTDCAEIDHDVYQIARAFFRLDELHHLTVLIEDGRSHLESLEPTPTYDCILIDAFSGTGSTPMQLSTMEFYDECRSRLVAGGVVVLNILDTDDHFDAKVETLRRSFDHLYRIQIDRSHLYFASDRAVERPTMETLAVELEAASLGATPLLPHARLFRRLPGPVGEGAPVLTDIAL